MSDTAALTAQQVEWVIAVIHERMKRNVERTRDPDCNPGYAATLRGVNEGLAMAVGILRFPPKTEDDFEAMLAWDAER